MSICLEERVAAPGAARNYARPTDGEAALHVKEPQRPEYGAPRYGVSAYTVASDEEADAAAARALVKHIKAFEELAKR